MRYKLKGAVTIEGGEPEMPLFVLVQVGGNLVDGFRLEATGRFEKVVTADNPPDVLQFLAFDNDDRNLGLVLSDYHEARIASSAWQKVDDSRMIDGTPIDGTGIIDGVIDDDTPTIDGTPVVELTSDIKTDIPWELVDRWGTDVRKEYWTGFSVPYRVHGRVVTRTATGKTLGVPNARVDVIEYDPQRKRWEVPSDPLFAGLSSFAESRDTLGVVWTDMDGNFEFSFTWGDLWRPGISRPVDYQPDILLRVSQQLDGRSVELEETQPRMSLEPQSRPWVIEVPIEKTLMLSYRDHLTSSVGFQAIGLLPVDHSRIKDGYADNSQYPHDLVSCRNAPFGGVLELYALIKNSQVTHYRLSYAPAGTADFEEVSDGLSNYVFDSAKKVWKGVALGPSKVGGVENLYRSIEHESGYLYDVKLKARWNTHSLKPGKYTLRLEGYRLEASTGQAKQVSVAVRPIDLRIDNTRPEVEILGVYRQGNKKPEPECGIIDLTANPKEPLTVKIRVRDPEGHLGAWRLSTQYGRNRSAGQEFTEGENYRSLQNPQIFWAGPGEKDVVLPNASTGSWIRCAYSFGLYAVGRSTNGRGSYIRSQEALFSQLTFIDA